MMRWALIFLVFSMGLARAQPACPVCEQAKTLQTELKKFAPEDAQAETARRQAVKLVVDFGESLPPYKQGAKAFEALVRLGSYGGGDGAYARALAVIGRKDPAYRRHYQAMIRKGLRQRDREELCRVRHLQTLVTVQECEFDEAAKGVAPEAARKRCSAEFALQQCLKKR